MDGVRRHLSYANVVATIALVVAIAGGTTAIAVSKGGKRADVNKKGNIRAARVTTPKLAESSVTASKVAAGNITAGQLTGVSLVQATGVVATASCPSGERMLSGGAVPLAGSTSGLDSSYPSESGNGWTASGGVPAGVRVIAVCLRATPGT